MAATKTKKTTTKRKTPARTARPTQETESKMTVEKGTSWQSAGYAHKVRSIPKVYLVGLLALIILGALLYLYKGAFIPAMVNGEPITRMQVVQELEKQGGKQTIDQIVTRTLIMQEARKKNVTVSDKEIDAQIAKIKADFAKQGQQLDQLLLAQNLSMADLREQIKTQQLINKMLGAVKITDKEVNDYIEKNKNQIPSGEVTPQLKATVKDQIKSQKLNDKYQTWIQELRKKAKITMWKTY